MLNWTYPLTPVPAIARRREPKGFCASAPPRLFLKTLKISHLIFDRRACTKTIQNPEFRIQNFLTFAVLSQGYGCGDPGHDLRFGPLLPVRIQNKENINAS
jgi:hypothetical protein